MLFFLKFLRFFFNKIGREAADVFFEVFRQFFLQKTRNSFFFEFFEEIGAKRRFFLELFSVREANVFFWTCCQNLKKHWSRYTNSRSPLVLIRDSHYPLHLLLWVGIQLENWRVRSFEDRSRPGGSQMQTPNLMQIEENLEVWILCRWNLKTV